MKCNYATVCMLELLQIGISLPSFLSQSDLFSCSRISSLGNKPLNCLFKAFKLLMSKMSNDSVSFFLEQVKCFLELDFGKYAPQR